MRLCVRFQAITKKQQKSQERRVTKQRGRPSPYSNHHFSSLFYQHTMVTLQALTAALLLSGVAANGTPDNVSSRLQVQVCLAAFVSRNDDDNCHGVSMSGRKVWFPCQHKISSFNFRHHVERSMFSPLI